MMRKMMKNSGLMGRLLSGGGLGGMGQSGFRNSSSRGSNFTPPKKKRKKR